MARTAEERVRRIQLGRSNALSGGDLAEDDSESSSPGAVVYPTENGILLDGYCADGEAARFFAIETSGYSNVRLVLDRIPGYYDDWNGLRPYQADGTVSENQIPLQPQGNPQNALIQTANVAGYIKVQLGIHCKSQWTKLSYYLW